MSEVIRIGIDLSKSVFVLYGVDQQEHCQLKRTLRQVGSLSVPGREADIAGSKGWKKSHWALVGRARPILIRNALGTIYPRRTAKNTPTDIRMRPIDLSNVMACVGAPKRPN